MYEYIENNFENRYKVLSKLGKGGMGSVFLAVTNDRLEHKRAIKEITFDMTVGQDVLQEAFIMKNLEHECIPRIIEIKECIDEGRIYIVQEYVEGVTLDDVLRKEKKIKDKIVYDWAKQLSDVLKYIHGKGILHRDIKMENIMLMKNGKIKLIDFGIASDDNDLEKKAYTPEFASPEQIRNEKIDGRSDIYSLGIVLYRLLTGEKPVLDKNLKSFMYCPEIRRDKYMPGLVAVINKAMEPEKSRRYKDSEKMYYDLIHVDRLTGKYKRKVFFKNLKIAIGLLFIVGGFFLMREGEVQLEIEKSEMYTELCDEAYEIVMSSGDMTSMETLLESALSLYPYKDKAYEIKLEALLRKRNYDEFFNYYLEVEEKVDIRSNERINYMIGTAYFELENYDKAVKYLGASYDDKEWNEKYARDYAVAEVRNDNLEIGKEVLEKLKSTSGLEASTYYVSGEYYKAVEDYDRAMEFFVMAKDSAKEFDLIKKSYISIAELYKSSNDHFVNSEKELIEILEEGIDVVRENNLILVEMLGEAYFNYADIQQDSKVKEEYFVKSYDNFQLLIDSGYERKYIYDNLVAIEKKLGNYYDAEELIVIMKRKYPEDASVQIQLIWVYLMKENLKNNLDRDYTKVISAFNELNSSYDDVEEKSDYIQIKQLMFELIDKNWIDREDLNI